MEGASIVVGLMVVLIGTIARPRPRPSRGEDPPVRLTVEVAWAVPGRSAGPAAEPGLDLELTEGRVVEAMAWPGRIAREARASPRRGAGGSARADRAGSGPGSRPRSGRA